MSSPWFMGPRSWLPTAMLASVTFLAPSTSTIGSPGFAAPNQSAAEAAAAERVVAARPRESVRDTT